AVSGAVGLGSGDLRGRGTAPSLPQLAGVAVAAPAFAPKDWCRAGIGDVGSTAGTAGRASIAEQLPGATLAEPITRQTSNVRAEWRAASRAELYRGRPARLWSARRDRCAP